MQKYLIGLVSELKPIREGIKNLPKAKIFPQLSSLTAHDGDGEEGADEVIRDIAEQYLRKFAFVSGAYKTLGLRDKMVSFTLGTR